jgi:hypothetical protein
MISPLPDKLAYLKEVIEKLETFEPDDLHEDNDEAFEIVTSSLKQRIKGMDKDEAAALLGKDQGMLEKWLDQSELDDSPAHYIYGILFSLQMYSSIDELMS